MILKGIDNQKVELKISENQEVQDFSDDAWLNIFISVHSRFGNWQTVDQSLMVSEFKELINWFNDLQLNRKVEYRELSFTEPNLEFQLIRDEENSKWIKMIFSAESKPKKAKEEQEYFVEFHFSNDDLLEVVREMNEEVKYFTK